MVKEERNQGSWGSYTDKVDDPITEADSLSFKDNGVLATHRNEVLKLWNYQVKQQDLVAEDNQDELYNHMEDNEVSFQFSTI